MYKSNNGISSINRDSISSGRDMKLQDVFLNHCRRESIAVSIQLLDKSIKKGLIVGFDSQSIILSDENKQHLVYKSATVAINPLTEVNYIFNDGNRHGNLNGCPEYTANFS
jgi:host factor-I protein